MSPAAQKILDCAEAIVDLWRELEAIPKDRKAARGAGHRALNNLERELVRLVDEHRHAEMCRIVQRVSAAAAAPYGRD